MSKLGQVRPNDPGFGAARSSLPVAWADLAFLTIAAAFSLATALRLPAAWSSGNALNHVSGSWMALADDLSRGTLYRPLHAPGGGFGGTRYFPLEFAIHAGLLRLGVDLLASGFAVSLAAGALLGLAAFLLLRGFGLSRATAAAFSALALAGFAGQHALSAVRGDLLPVALSVLGLAALARGGGGASVAAAAGAFSLAFAAKPTSLTAPVAAIAHLMLTGSRRTAGALAAGVAAGVIAVVAGTNALSGGRFLPLVRLGASAFVAGGLVRAPFRLAEQLWVGDLSGLVLLLSALVALGAGATGLRSDVLDRRRAPPLLLAALWLACALAGVVAVLASPGTGVNHLVEIEAASAVALGAATRARGRTGTAARIAAPAAALAGLAMAVGMWRADLSSSRLCELGALRRALPRGGPVLSEDPLVPLLAGERPWIVDPWMLRLAAARDPSTVLPLVHDLGRGAFPALVLLRDLDDPAATASYARGSFGPLVTDEMRRAYRRASVVGRYHVYVPRDSTVAGEARGGACGRPGGRGLESGAPCSKPP